MDILNKKIIEADAINENVSIENSDSFKHFQTTDFIKTQNKYKNRNLEQLTNTLKILNLDINDIDGDVISVTIKDPNKVVLVYGEIHNSPEVIRQQINTITNFQNKQQALTILKEGIRFGLGINNLAKLDITPVDYFNRLFFSKNNMFTKIKGIMGSKKEDSFLVTGATEKLNKVLDEYPGLSLNYLLSIFYPKILIRGIDSPKNNFSSAINEASKTFIIDERNKVFLDSIISIVNNSIQGIMKQHYLAVVGASHVDYLESELANNEISVVSIIPKNYTNRPILNEGYSKQSSLQYYLYMRVGYVLSSISEQLIANITNEQQFNNMFDQAQQDLYLTNLITQIVYSYEANVNKSITDINFYCRKNNLDYSSYISIIHELIIPNQINFYFSLFHILNNKYQIRDITGLINLLNRIEPRFCYFILMQVFRKDPDKYSKNKAEYLDSISDFIKTKWKDFNDLSEYEFEVYEERLIEANKAVRN